MTLEPSPPPMYPEQAGTGWSVSELARAAGVSVRVLRHWDELGLVTPARTAGGHRRYTPAEVIRLYQALALRQTGLPLDRIAALLTDRDPDPAATLREHLRRVDAELEHLSPHSRITAVDRSPTSLTEARRRVRAAGLYNVEFEQADVFALPFRPATPRPPSPTFPTGASSPGPWTPIVITGWVRPMRKARMRTIGMLGGMSWESTAEYYRLVNKLVRDRLGGLHSAQLLLASVDFADIERWQATDQWKQAGRFLAVRAAGLEAAGAELLVLCTNTMHKVADQIAAAVSIPFLHMADTTAAAVRCDGLSRPVPIFPTTRLHVEAAVDLALHP